MLNLYGIFLKKYKGKVLLVIALLLCSTLCNLFLPMMSKNIINNGIGNQDIKLIYGLGLVMLFILIIGFGFTVLGNYVSSDVAMGFSKDIRKAFFKHVGELSQGDIEQIGTSSLISRQINDIMQMQMALVQMLNIMLMAPLMCIGGIIMAVLTAPQLSWIIVCILPITLVIAIAIMIRINPVFKQNQIKLDKVNLIMREALSGMRVLRAFNKEEFEKERFGKASYDLMETSLKANRTMTIIMPLISFCVSIANILIIWFGAHSMMEGNASYGDIQAFIQYVSMILMSLMMTSMLMVILPRAITSGERLKEVFEWVPSVQDPDNPKLLPEHSTVTIRFDKVSYTFKGSSEKVLSDISFEAKAGQTLAIIGGTGSGKSTIVNLIARYIDPTEGNIYINDTNIKEITQKDLRSKLGIVPQKAFLFSGSILDNLRYGKENATEESVMHALKVAQAEDFVNKSDYGIYTYITQSGTNVSGGQRQRLAIARAVVRKPAIYMFDDSFSALDFKTDAKLRRELAKEVKDSIMIIVAQRVGTIIDADQILVLDAGHIVGKGTHTELLNHCEVYREIAGTQMSESEVSAVG
jgi:ATP-binding cassette, subfamily B, multidrug efflux pump